MAKACYGKNAEHGLQRGEARVRSLGDPGAVSRVLCP